MRGGVVVRGGILFQAMPTITDVGASRSAVLPLNFNIATYFSRCPQTLAMYLA